MEKQLKQKINVVFLTFTQKCYISVLVLQISIEKIVFILGLLCFVLYKTQSIFRLLFSGILLFVFLWFLLRLKNALRVYFFSFLKLFSKIEIYPVVLLSTQCCRCLDYSLILHHSIILSVQSLKCHGCSYISFFLRMYFYHRFIHQMSLVIV